MKFEIKVEIADDMFHDELNEYFSDMEIEKVAKDSFQELLDSAFNSEHKAFILPSLYNGEEKVEVISTEIAGGSYEND